MAKLKIFAVSVIAAFAISVVATASASAACSGEEWCVTGSPLVGSAELAEETKVIETFVWSIPALKFKIECSILKIKKGLLVSPDKITAESLIFEECKTVEGAPECELEGTTITTKAIETEGTVKAVGTKGAEATVKPTAGSFANIKIKTGKGCPLSGTQAVTGKVKILFPTGQEEKVEQELVINTGVGELKVGADEATLKGKTKIRLKSGSAFSFH